MRLWIFEHVLDADLIWVAWALAALTVGMFPRSTLLDELLPVLAVVLDALEPARLNDLKLAGAQELLH